MTYNLDVKTALEIFEQSKSQDEVYLIEKLASVANIDSSSISKNALISKLYRYRSKIKAKRGKFKIEFENDLFSIPVATNTSSVKSKGKLHNFEIAAYENTCVSIASDLHNEQVQSKLDLESLKNKHEHEIKQIKYRHLKELSSLKRSHAQDTNKSTKKLKLAIKKSDKKTLLESNKKQKSVEKLKEVMKSKTDLTYKHILLQRQLARYKSKKHKQKIGTKLGKLVIQEKKKVTKYISEVETLKLDNMKLKAKIIEQQDKITTIEHQLHSMEEKESLTDLETSIRSISEERDYLHTLLQDNSELSLFDVESNRYTPQTRQCIMNLTSHNVSSENVGPVIKQVLKLANKCPNAVPSRKTVDNIIAEKIAIGQKQIGTTLIGQKNTCLYGDETRKFGKTYQTFLLSDENKNVYFLGLRDMLDKAASTTLDVFKNILDDISDICEQNRQKNIISPGHSILCNIRDFMSDRAQTNIAFNDLLEQYRLDIMPNFISNWNKLSDAERSITSKVNNFFCGLHLLVNFAECLSPILKLFEKMQETESSLQDNFSDEDEAPEIQVFSTDSKTISFLRFCGKCFGRGVDEKSGCYSSFRTHVENENEKVLFVDFRGNRFNIIFLMGQIAYYHHPRILNFFESVHGAKNKLHKLTLQLVKKTYIIACCKVLGLISKLITAPLWRLIESTKHVLHLNENYFALLQYLERMSKDANSFVSGEEYPFSDDLMEKDKIFDNLIQPVNGIDEKACAFAQMAFKGLHGVLERAMKEQLPGGKFFEPTQELLNESKSVIPHNKLPERVFGMLDFFLRYRPNASTISNEAFLMFVFNKSSDWLETLSQEEREKLLNDSIKEGREVRVMYRKRLAEITEHRKQKLKDKQIALEKKQKAVLKAKSKHTNDIIYFGLWQNRDQVGTILEEIPGVSEKRKALISQIRFRQKVLKQSVSDKKIYHVIEKGKAHSIDKLTENVLKLIKDAGEGVGSERKSQNVPLFVGKRVVHTFEDGKWNGRVISVVQGFPDFYNIIYDKDVEDTTTPTAIYTYKLKEDCRNGNLEIIPDVPVVRCRSCLTLQLAHLLTR